MNLLKKLSLMAFVTTLTLICLFTAASAVEVTPTNKMGIVTAGALNVRQWAVPDVLIVGTLYRGDVVNITGVIGDWYQIAYRQGNAYVFASYVQIRSDILPSRGDYDRTSKGQNIVDFAKKYIGVPYVYGGSSPSGFDCSGFTSFVYKQFGYSINRTSQSQLNNGTYVSKENLRPGDLVFFYSAISHVGIYVGNGQMIHSPKPGRRVCIESIAPGSHYGSNYMTARRIIN